MAFPITGKSSNLPRSCTFLYSKRTFLVEVHDCPSAFALNNVANSRAAIGTWQVDGAGLVTLYDAWAVDKIGFLKFLKVHPNARDRLPKSPSESSRIPFLDAVPIATHRGRLSLHSAP